MPGILFYNNRLTNCCGCINLSTGCRIIGSITALICCMEFLNTINKFMELVRRKRKCQENVHWDIDVDHFFHLDCHYITIVRFILITEFLAFVMGFVSSLLLLYGLRKKQPGFFVTWLIFIGTVICSNFFSILFWRDASVIFEKMMLVIILAYFFRVVKSYRSQLIEEASHGDRPVVAVAIPQESGMRIFFPSRRSEVTEDIKADPPPPYPGPPLDEPSVSFEVQPPPYSAIIPNYRGTPSPSVSDISISHISTIDLQRDQDRGISLSVSSSDVGLEANCGSHSQNSISSLNVDGPDRGAGPSSSPSSSDDGLKSVEPSLSTGSAKIDIDDSPQTNDAV